MFQILGGSPGGWLLCQTVQIQMMSLSCLKPFSGLNYTEETFTLFTVACIIPQGSGPQTNIVNSFLHYALQHTPPLIYTFPFSQRTKLIMPERFFPQIFPFLAFRFLSNRTSLERLFMITPNDPVLLLSEHLLHCNPLLSVKDNNRTYNSQGCCDIKNDYAYVYMHAW